MALDKQRPGIPRVVLFLPLTRTTDGLKVRQFRFEPGFSFLHEILVVLFTVFVFSFSSVQIRCLMSQRMSLSKSLLFHLARVREISEYCCSLQSYCEINLSFCIQAYVFYYQYYYYYYYFYLIISCFFNRCFNTFSGRDEITHSSCRNTS